MSLSAWRSRGRLLVQCDVCSSRGHPAVAAVESVQDPSNAAIREAVAARSNELRRALEGGVAETMRLNGVNAIHRDEAAARIRALSDAHATGMRALIDENPGMDDGVSETLSGCPWCGVPGSAVVLKLPDGVAEPPEWSTKSGA